MAIGLVLSLAGAYAVSQWEERVTRIEFEGVADTQSIIMQNGMNEYISRQVALRTLFESANEEITRSEFEAFAGRLFERHPGILRVAWLPRVNRKERAEYEAAAISEGISGYRIKSPNADGSITTAAQSDEYYPVFFSTEPKTSMVYGLDYATAPERRAMLERARDNDMITTVRDRLYQPHNGVRPVGVLVTVPVYAKGTSRTTVTDRRRNLAGFVVAVFNLQPLLHSIRTTTAASPAVRIDVYPPDAARMGQPAGVAEFSSEPRQPGSMPVPVTAPHWSGVLKIGDASWQVRATPAAGGPLNAHYYRALAVLAVGIVITAFLAAYLWLASRNAHQLARANRRVLELAQTDILTGLPNRAFFLAQLHDVNSRQPRGKGAFSILMLDLDRFKNVNDSLGHAAGDELLRQVAHRLRSALHSTDVLARLGGDEFAVIQAGCGEPRRGSLDLAARISKLIAEPFLLPGHRVEIGALSG
jgi:diguanylate cyclase (GGDEF)-like protein